MKTKSAGSFSEPSFDLDGIIPEANWIWGKSSGNSNNYLHFRKTFVVNKVPDYLDAYVSAYNFAELYINGLHIDRVPTNSDPEYQTYEKINIAPFLQRGKNIIAALVYNAGAGLHHRIKGRGGFFFQASIGDLSGEEGKILSDKSWKTLRNLAWKDETPYRQTDHTIGFREKYDSRLACEGWEQAAFDDSRWENASELGIPPVKPWNNMVVVDRQRLFYEVLYPVKSWNSMGYVIFDFGTIITASPRFQINSSESGIHLNMGTGETLNCLKFPRMKENINYTDSYISKEGSQCWKPLTWRSFRYLAIQKKKGISLDKISAEFRSFPVEKTGSFRCSDPLLNKIWEVGQRTLQICAHDTWMDTPWREQTHYIAGDGRYNLHYSSYAFGCNVKLLHDYNILCGAYSQRHSPDHAIRSRYPTDSNLGPTSSTYIPDYQLEWILMIQEHYAYFNDSRLIGQIYPNIVKLLEYFKRFISDRGLLGKVPGCTDETE